MVFDSSLSSSGSIIYIYVVTNLLNGKQYVGKHTSPSKKSSLGNSYLGSGILIKESINKNGFENFHKEILEYSSKDKWKIQEKFWIDEKKSLYPDGYNLTKGGDGTCGYSPWNKGMDMNKNGYHKTLSEETKKKQSISHLGNKNPMYGKDAWSAINKKIFECEYCHIKTNKGNYIRWHGERCKHFK